MITHSSFELDCAIPAIPRGHAFIPFKYSRWVNKTEICFLLERSIDRQRIDVGYAAELAVADQRQLGLGPLAVPHVIAVCKAFSIGVAIDTKHPPPPCTIEEVAIVFVDGEVPERVVREMHLDELDVGPGWLEKVSAQVRRYALL